MNTRLMLSLVVIVVLLTSVGGAAAHKTSEVSTAEVSTGFTFQGQLENAGAAVNGNCDMAFRLYDDAAADTPIGSAITTTVPVSNSLFTVMLNTGGEFGANAFDGAARWLEMTVRCPAGSGGYTPLTPRQALTAVPYSRFALSTGALQGYPVTATAPTTGQVLKWNGNAWMPDIDNTEAFALPGPGAAATVDSSAGVVGEYTSLTIGTDGLGLISYYDHSNGDLKVLHCGNAACTSGNTVTTVDSAGNVGYFTSITLGADGLGLISYWDGSNQDLKVLHCGNAACTGGNISTTVDSVGNVGRYSSLTIGADGLGLISYYDLTNGGLKVLHCGNAACTGGNISTTVDNAGGIDQITSITIGADGLGLISYRDGNAALKVLHCGNAACNSGNTATTVDSAGNVGYYPSTTIGADGLGLISYHDDTNAYLKVLHCGNTTCTSGNTVTIVDSGGATGADVGDWTSITIGADGLGLISYLHATNGVLKVMHCGNAACTSGNISTAVDSASWVGECTSIAIGADGLGLISYYDRTNGDLKVLHCGNRACTPYRVGR